ncbi:hypothetical protein AM1_0436 [Acaryochloris marina MBIC11017]|uniref:Uncharacterized protein n=1 Tax=Acaryochloris marina (strain MBIC 11017) TaxID=329726 RepID=B0CB02_ACAM1|nr:hypothetical protein AM1_0436 [Acaryochloris marina MBIC11017]
MVPENNSKFVDQVNYTLVRFMEGYLKSKEPYVTTFRSLVWATGQSASF